MAEAQTYTLKAPEGTVVQVKGAARRDVLLGRGYAEVKGSSSKKASSGDEAK